MNKFSLVLGWIMKPTNIFLFAFKLPLHRLTGYKTRTTFICLTRKHKSHMRHKNASPKKINVLALWKIIPQKYKTQFSSQEWDLVF